MLDFPSTQSTGHRVYGVMIAIVTDNKDPEGLGRVKLRFPELDETDTTLWARVSVPMAGADRGTFLLPEVGDEVLVAFAHGDISVPFVLGSLWNGTDTPPDTNSNGQNNLRFIKSRSGHLVRLDDTDGAEKIEIIDKSGNNSITFDTANNTITIDSAKDVEINAPQGKIKLTAQNIELSSTADTKIQAQGGATLDGSPGTTTVKGTTVNIN
ncbi:MAG: phage baseplate assembly protein V [Acidobacteria bacterium]|nr:phage baseplate assembly protein V [Acidobacteriota bacterium]